MKSFRLRIVLTWLCYATIFWTVLHEFIMSLFLVCFIAPIVLRYMIRPVFPKWKFSRLMGWGMFLTIVATLLYCSWLHFNDAWLQVFVYGLLAAFGILLAFTVCHDTKLWRSEPASIAFNELAVYLRKSRPYLISIFAVGLPIVCFFWFVASHGYDEFNVAPLILSAIVVAFGVKRIAYDFRHSWKLGLERIVVMLFVLFFVGLIFRPIIWPYHCTPWAAHRARQNIGLIHPGMTAPQVWETLGLTSYKFRTRSSGSGPPNAWPINYQLWPGDCLFCRWNNMTNPPILVLGYMKNSINDITHW